MPHATYRDRFMSAAEAPAREREAFIRKTYLHLGGAVLAFVGLTALLIRSPVAPAMLEWMAGSQYSWLMVLGLFMLVGWVAERWARSSASVGMQYAGLALYVVAEAFLFTPMLFIAAYYAGPDVIPTAGLLTAIVFGGLTVSVLVTKQDFSFMGRFLMIGGFAAMGFILVAILFGFTLGSLFSTAMVVLAAGYILYYTSNVLHHYPIGSHVAASLALFAAVALLFWYILQLVMAFTGDD